MCCSQFVAAWCRVNWTNLRKLDFRLAKKKVLYIFDTSCGDPVVQWLGHRVFIPATGVRLPSGLPFFSFFICVLFAPILCLDLGLFWFRLSVDKRYKPLYISNGAMGWPNWDPRAY